MKLSDQPKLYVFFLLPDFPMVPLATSVEPMRMSNRLSGEPLYAWKYASIDGNPVVAANGMVTQVDFSLDEIRKSLPHSTRPDGVIVCSGNDPERFENRSLLAFLRECHNQGLMLGGISSGAHFLAAAKLLNGRKCVIHWEHIPALTQRFPEVDARSELYEIDGNLCTSAGGIATLDMMLSMIHSDHGADLTNQVCEQVITDKVRVPGQRQRLLFDPRCFRNDKIPAIVKLMEDNLTEPLSLSELAQLAGVSRRQIERLFLVHLDTSPARFYLELRLERARHLLLQTNLQIVEVSNACGFASASHFSRCYRKHHGLLPNQERSIA